MKNKQTNRLTPVGKYWHIKNKQKDKYKNIQTKRQACKQTNKQTNKQTGWHLTVVNIDKWKQKLPDENKPIRTSKEIWELQAPKRLSPNQQMQMLQTSMLALCLKIELIWEYNNTHICSGGYLGVSSLLAT